MEGNTDGGIYPRGFSANTDWPWPLVKSSELVGLNYGKALRAGDRCPGDVPIYGTNGQCGWHDTPLQEGPGVILGRKGQGPLGVEWCDSDYWVIDTAYFVTRKNDALDLRYFFYLVKYIGLNHLKDGTSNPGLSRDTFADLLLPFPPTTIQEAISEIARSLDDKIELNRRMNGVLEGMARAIFKAWFIDFEPVKAKAAGATRFPGMPPHVFDALPNQLVNSELGEIPEGWEVKRWGDIATLEYGKGLKGYRDAKGAVRVWGTNGPIGWHTAALCDSAGIIIGRKGAYRGVHYSPSPFFVIDTAFYLKPTQSFEMLWAYYELLEIDINSMDSGSAIPSTSRNDFYAIPVRVPSAESLAGFSKIVGLLYEIKYANENECLVLSTIRDTLLPKLISGEIPVGAPSGGGDGG